MSSTRKADDVNYDAEGVFNWAANESFGARFVVGRNQRAGFIDERRLIALDGPNVAAPGPEYSKPAVPVGNLPSDPETFEARDDVNDSEMDYLRAKIRVEGGERFSLELTYDLQDYASDSRALDNPQFAGLDEYESTGRILYPVERELELGALDIESDFGFATLAVNASTYRDDVDTTGDWTDVARGYVGVFYFAPYGFAEPPRLQGTSFYFGENDGDVLEARLTSNGDERFNWMVGGFYTKQDQSFMNELWLPGITAYSDAVGHFWPFRPPFFPDAEGVPDDLIWSTSAIRNSRRSPGSWTATSTSPTAGRSPEAYVFSARNSPPMRTRSCTPATSTAARTSQIRGAVTRTPPMKSTRTSCCGCRPASAFRSDCSAI